jgi:hypothetical protein
MPHCRASLRNSDCRHARTSGPPLTPSIGWVRVYCIIRARLMIPTLHTRMQPLSCLSAKGSDRVARTKLPSILPNNECCNFWELSICRFVAVVREGNRQRVIPMRTLIASSAIIAALFAAAPGASAQESGAFCLRGSDSGQLNCSYNTMAQCQAALRGASSENCVNNPRTTGSGAGAGGARSGAPGPSNAGDRTPSGGAAAPDRTPSTAPTEQR